MHHRVDDRGSVGGFIAGGLWAACRWIVGGLWEDVGVVGGSKVHCGWIDPPKVHLRSTNDPPMMHILPTYNPPTINLESTPDASTMEVRSTYDPPTIHL